MFQKFLTVITIVAILVAPLSTAALETKTLTNVMRSVVRLQTENGSTFCTGFVVMPGRVMTAAHCTGDGEIYIDGLKSTLLKADDQRDLALLFVEGLKRPYLRFTDKPVEIGRELTAIGFPYGGSALIVLDREVAGENLVLRQCMFTGGCVEWFYTVVVNGTYAPGMSGGPNVDEKGHIVAITQAGIGTLGLGQNADVMKDFISR